MSRRTTCSYARIICVSYLSQMLKRRRPYSLIHSFSKFTNAELIPLFPNMTSPMVKLIMKLVIIFVGMRLRTRQDSLRCLRNCKGDISAIGMVNFNEITYMRAFNNYSRYRLPTYSTAFIKGLLILLSSKRFVVLLLKWEYG